MLIIIKLIKLINSICGLSTVAIVISSNIYNSIVFVLSEFETYSIFNTMHTVHSDYDPSPYPANYQYFPSRYSKQGELPMHENDLEVTTRVVPLRTAPFHSKQEYDCPDSPDLVGDDLVNTLIVGDDLNIVSDRSPGQVSLHNLPPQIVELIISLDDSSQTLSISQKQSLSHQLTKMSLSLQTQCLYGDTNQEWDTHTKRCPSPPIFTPRKPNPQTPSVPIVTPRISTPTAPCTDWSGPGSFPTYQEQHRPTKLNISTLPASPHHQRSTSVQYDQKCLVKQKSDDVIYANTSSTPSNTSCLHAPPLPPRDNAPGPEYQNLPPNRGSKKRINY